LGINKKDVFNKDGFILDLPHNLVISLLKLSIKEIIRSKPQILIKTPLVFALNHFYFTYIYLKINKLILTE